MNNITIATTNSIENAKIERYLGVVSTNVVLGTNVFSDFAASFTDFFGGTSETYQGKLDIIYKKAIDSLSQKAIIRGANCIIGLNVDFDEISGKGKSMFMISATGTAVSISLLSNIDNNGRQNSHIISAEQLSNEYQKRCLINEIKSGKLPNEVDWNFLANNFDVNVAKLLLDVYLNKYLSDLGELNDSEKHLLNNFPLYFKKFETEEATSLVYNNIENYRALELIRKSKLFNAELILQMVGKDDIETVIELLDADKAFYTKEDLPSMKKLLFALENISDKGTIETVKGLFSKGDEKYICPSGHKNSKSVKYCTDCGLNMKGLTQKQVDKIAVFRLKIESLEALL